MSTGKGENEILDAGEFAMIKEYIEVGGSDIGIARVTGLSRKIVANIRKAPHYKQYMDDLKVIHRSKLEEATPPTPATALIPEDLQKVLVNLTDAIVGMTNRWESLESKLDEITATRRPWLGRGSE
jgi:hypothetical protein